jgi:hypothetical protein
VPAFRVFSVSSSTWPQVRLGLFALEASSSEGASTSHNGLCVTHRYLVRVTSRETVLWLSFNGLPGLDIV